MIHALVFAFALDPGGVSFVVESRVGPRPPSADAELAAVVRGMAPLAPLQGVSLDRAIAARVSRPSGSDDLARLERLQGQYERGYEFYLQGEFARAIAILKPLVEELLGNPAMAVKNQLAADTLFRALAVLAHAQFRGATELGRGSRRAVAALEDEAKATMAELIRTFPNLSVSAFGNEVVDFHRYVGSELKRAPGASLHIQADWPGAAIFVNERYVGTGSVQVTPLSPGRYRVLTQVLQRVGRVHTIELRPGARAELRIPAAFDAALRTLESGFVGFQFANAVEQQRWERACVITLGRALGARVAFVLRSTVVSGRPTLVGTELDIERGTIGRSAQAPLGPGAPDAPSLMALGHSLTHGGPPVPVAAHDRGSDEPAHVADIAPAPGARPMRFLKWTALAVGLATVGIGAALVAIDGSGSCDHPLCPSTYSTAGTGWVVVGLGAALLVTSSTLLVLEGKSTRIAAELGPGRAAVTAGMRF